MVSVDHWSNANDGCGPRWALRVLMAVIEGDTVGQMAKSARGSVTSTIVGADVGQELVADETGEEQPGVEEALLVKVKLVSTTELFSPAPGRHK